MTDHPTTDTEYGVRLTWPDGHSVTHPATDRALAEADCRIHRGRLRRGESRAVPEVVSRQLQPWAVVDETQPTRQTA